MNRCLHGIAPKQKRLKTPVGFTQIVQPTGDGGLGWGTTTTSLVFLTTILALVAFLSMTRCDVIPAASLVPSVAPEGAS